jgi:hypothetical protein
MDLQKSNPTLFKYKVVGVYNTRERANAVESRLHNKFSVSSNDSFYNRCNQNADGFCIFGRVSVKSKSGQTSSVRLDDERYLSGELIPAAVGTLVVRDVETNTSFSVSRDDPRLLDGSIISTARPYARISNGVDERTYRLDGTDTIPDGWFLVYLNFEMVNVHDHKTGAVVAKNVSCQEFCESRGLTRFIGNNLAKTRYRDLSKKSNSWNLHQVHSMFVVKSEIDLSKVVNIGVKKKKISFIDMETGKKVKFYADSQVDSKRYRKVYPFDTPGVKMIRDYQTGLSFTCRSDDPRIESGEYLTLNKSYVRITNGIDERPYRVDGSDSIPEGWTIS